MTKTKKSIVFCHGIWADGSCFNRVIPALQAEGFEVMSEVDPKGWTGKGSLKKRVAERTAVV